MRTIVGTMLLTVTLLGSGQGAHAAAACNPTRLEDDMRCCLMKTCPEREGSRAVKGAVESAPTNQALFNLRRGFGKCQGLDERNNFYACERADKKGPYNIGRRILGLPPG